MRIIIVCTILFISLNSFSQDWNGIPVPADAGEGMVWELQVNVSDDFNYTAAAENKGETFTSKWKDSYVNAWTGGSGTTWRPDHSSVDGANLVSLHSRVPGTTDKTYSAAVSSLETVIYPVFLEANAKLSKSVFASCFWMVSFDQTQEIDIIEAFGTDRPGKEWYNQRLHLSHHVFIRNPFQDYQPTDDGSWYTDNGTVWEHAFHRSGVYWKDPHHLEYYIDGEMVRVLHYNALANKKDGVWTYAYPTMVDGELVKDGGYQILTNYTSSEAFSLATLQAASSASDVSIIDAYGYTEGGLTKPEYLLITSSQQSWTGMTATDEELEDPAKNTYLVDWIRVYKPTIDTKASPRNSVSSSINIYPQPCNEYLKIKSELSLDQLTIYNIEGGLVKTFEMNGKEKIVNTSDFLRGFYLIKALAEDGSYSYVKITKM